MSRILAERQGQMLSRLQNRPAIRGPDGEGRIARFAQIDRLIAIEDAGSRPWICRNGRVVRQIIELVADHLQVPSIEVCGQSHKPQVVYARHVAMYLARTLTAATYPEIGRAFGGRCHTGAIRAVRKIQRQLTASPEVRRTVAALKRALAEARANG